MSIYLHLWKDTGIAGVKDDFGITDGALDGVNILLAAYEYEDYSGSAYVLFERAGELYEVVGGHCSCHGLSSQNYYCEGDTQWEPEPTTVEAVRQRLDADYHLDLCREELRELLDTIDKSANQ